jgi:phospholipase/carboxylesterase
MDCLDNLVASLSARGCPRDALRLVGFSQGACIVAEYICRHPQHYGGVAALTGGLIGPEGTTWSGDSLADTPILLATSDIDPWIPLARAEESRDVLTERGAVVDFRVYEGMDHIINDDEIAALRQLIIE